MWQNYCHPNKLQIKVIHIFVKKKEIVLSPQVLYPWGINMILHICKIPLSSITIGEKQRTLTDKNRSLLTCTNEVIIIKK